MESVNYKKNEFKMPPPYQDFASKFVLHTVNLKAKDQF